MDKDELEAIQEYVRYGASRWKGDEVESVVGIINDLLAEVERLRTENAELREIAAALDALGVRWDTGMGRNLCICCGRMAAPRESGDVSHKPDCTVTRARALMGKAGE